MNPKNCDTNKNMRSFVLDLGVKYTYTQEEHWLAYLSVPMRPMPCYTMYVGKFQRVESDVK